MFSHLTYKERPKKEGVIFVYFFSTRIYFCLFKIKHTFLDGFFFLSRDAERCSQKIFLLGLAVTAPTMVDALQSPSDLLQVNPNLACDDICLSTGQSEHSLLVCVLHKHTTTTQTTGDLLCQRLQPGSEVDGTWR